MSAITTPSTTPAESCSAALLKMLSNNWPASAPNAARHGGFDANQTVWLSMLIGGGVAGLAGALEFTGALKAVNLGFPSGYGFTAIIVAFLGRLHPIGVLIAGIVLAITYVGGDLVSVGRQWAQYLVDNDLVQEGDFVWMPVEVPGATYGVQEEEGIREVFEPLGITYEVTDATLDQAEVITRMTDYVTANRGEIDAMIGLGDMVTGSVQRVFDQAGVPAGEIPVVGWGNSLDTTQAVMDGYVNAAMWQDPQATS